ncbi:leucine-rich repeat protein, putative [Bodo saltans]|uniref:Leucine-rich repeat protein, putative n=1 Tax=Bodo saltans TaxID=75058 RepID=A0A0S4JCL5_BODSA|nr:leucine-rich repeat protein, putative [Bodo saltans]|eukprot:CUG86044.1 leucine-rich repeat protein, putative [Bodo saltans]
MLRSDAFIPRIRTNDPAVFELSFAGRRPTAPTLRILGDALKHNTSLKRLDFSDCHLTNEDVTPLLQLLECNKGVTHLSLANNPDISEATVLSLRRCILGANNTLSFVVLDGTGVSADAQQDLNFIISLNKFPTQLKQQAHRARSNEENFFTFELTHDTTDPKVYNEESARLVSTSLAHNTVIRTLKLNRCCVGEHSLKELRYLFQINTTLRRVALQENFLGSDSAVMIATAIGKAGAKSSIQDIDLSINEIDDEGCDAFTQLLEENTNIRVVSLVRNRCTQVALDRLRTACALNCEPAELKPLLPRLQRDDPTIVSIILPGTADVAARGPGRGYFTSLGAATISEALLHNTHVHSIILPSNHIGADGAKALASLVARTQSVTAIDISRNPINDEGARHLILGLRQNDSVVELRVDGCNVSSRAMSEIAALCHLNVQPLPIKKLLAKGVEGTAQEDPLRAGVLNLAYQPKQPAGKWKGLHSESMPYILTILSKIPTITELDMCDNVTMGDAAVLQLVPYVRDPACRLRKLLLCNTGITDVTLNAFTDAMRVNYALQSIVITPNSATTTRPQQRLDEAVQHNQFPAAVKDLILPLQKNVDGIDEVKFVRNANVPQTVSSDPVEAPYGDDAMRILTAALQSNTKVTRFVYSGHRMSNRGMGYLCELLLHNTTLTEVDVSNNDVGPDGVEDLSSMLEQNVTLLSLNIGSNPLTEVGGARLLNALQTANRALQHICVDNCRLIDLTKRKIDAQVAANTQPAMFRSILEKVSGIPVVKCFGDASIGFLDARSVQALHVTLQCAPSVAHIRSIELPHNHLGDEGLKHFVELAATLPNLVSVDLFDNNMTLEVAVPLLKEMCLRSSKLNSIRVFPTDVHASDPGLQEIDDLLNCRTITGDEGLKHFVELAATLPNLVSVDLFDNNMTLEVAVPLLKEMCLRSSKLNSIRVFPTDVHASDPGLQEIDDLLKLHDEAPSFQATYVRLQTAINNLPSAASLANSLILSSSTRTASTGPTTMLEVSDAPLSVTSFLLLVRLLQRRGGCGHWIRGISLQRCSLESSSLINGLIPLLECCTRLAGLQLRELTTLNDDEALALVKVMQQTPTILQADIDASIFSGEEYYINTTKSLIEAHRHAAAVTAVENIFVATQQLTSAAVSRVPGQKNRTSAAGRPAAAVRSLEEESAVLMEIMQDALEQMPNRTPYQRGMYSVKK